MTARRRSRGWVLLAVGAVALAGAGYIAFAPGFQLAPPQDFGTTLTAPVTAGEYAYYVTPSDSWSRIECSGEVAGEEAGTRISMTQQDIVIPQAWQSHGSFPVSSDGTATLTCVGPVAGGRFTIGPVMDFFPLAGAGALGIAGAITAAVGGVRVTRARPRG